MTIELSDRKIDSTINNVLRGRARRHVLALSVLNCDWPDSTEVVRALYKFITTDLENDDLPVFYIILERALDEYSAVLYHKRTSKYPDPVRIGMFLGVLISEASKALQIEAKVEGGETWTSTNEESLAQWIGRQESNEISITPRHTDEGEDRLRQRLYDLITSDGMKKVLRRMKYEEAVVAGRMDRAYPGIGGNASSTR